MLIFLLVFLVVVVFLVCAIKSDWDEGLGIVFMIVSIFLFLPITIAVVSAQIDRGMVNTANEYRIRLENYSLLDDTTGDVYQYNLRNFKKEIIAFNILLAEKQQDRKSIWVRWFYNPSIKDIKPVEIEGEPNDKR